MLASLRGGGSNLSQQANETQRWGLGLIWFFQRGRPVLQAQPAERRKSWTVPATIADALHRAQPRGANVFAFGDRQSLAPYWQAKPAPNGPICEASRPAFLARPSAISENRKRSDGSSRARSAAPRSFRTGTIGAWPVSSGLVRFDDFEMQWNGNAACAVAVQRNGEAANCRVRPGRGRKRPDTWSAAQAAGC